MLENENMKISFEIISKLNMGTIDSLFITRKLFVGIRHASKFIIIKNNYLASAFHREPLYSIITFC